MTEQYALQLAALRADRLGWTHFDHQPRVINVFPGERTVIESNDSLHLLIESPQGISIESQTGFYDPTNSSVNEQSEEFTGKITITNRTTAKKQIRFLQVLPRQKSTD